MVCLSVMFVHCAQTAEDIDTISLAYDSPMSLPDRVKIWLTSVNPFLPKFCPKVTHRVDLSVVDIRRQIAVEWFRDSAMVTMESLQDTTVALLNGAIADPLRPPFPQSGCPKCITKG